MTITAKVIEHSVSSVGKELITMELRYPRFIHAEVMTHRVFSRNASSSRAIPVQRLIDDVWEDPAMPIHWGKNQPGMQAREEQNKPVYLAAANGYVGPESAWRYASSLMIEIAQAFNEAGYHKQFVNRLLEPFCHITVVVSATEWDNFFTLRDHPDAQPEIQDLARKMKAEIKASIPHMLGSGEWHLPYVTEDERAAHYERDLLKMSTARCARVSYKTHDGRLPTYEEDMALFERLVGSEPAHASPTEHAAVALSNRETRSGNFLGWRQFREYLGV